MQAIERIRAALNAASCGPWIEAGPSFGRPLPEYFDSVVQDCGDGDCSIAICRDTETSDASYIAACNPAAMDEVLAHIAALEAENERLRAESEERLQNCAALVAEVERLRKDAERMKEGLKAVEELIDQSSGVAGLHLNGDLALWSELRTGGCNEGWLLAFDEAIDAAIKGTP